jgi:hypothetical protein
VAHHLAPLNDPPPPAVKARTRAGRAVVGQYCDRGRLVRARARARARLRADPLLGPGIRFTVDLSHREEPPPQHHDAPRAQPAMIRPGVGRRRTRGPGVCIVTDRTESDSDGLNRGHARKTQMSAANFFSGHPQRRTGCQERRGGSFAHESA